MEKKNVALVLSSGGPRGWAYIGAIEELVSRGYNITSITGTSIGSLIGGVYAAGKMDDIKEWLFTLDAWKVFGLMDISLSKNHLVKGNKVIEAIKEIVPEKDIRDLNIPYRAIAADLYTGEEVVFDRGPLFDAIRASISIPSLFRPVRFGYRTLMPAYYETALKTKYVSDEDSVKMLDLVIENLHVDSGFLYVDGTGNFHQNMRTAWIGKNNSNISSALQAIDRVITKQLDKLNSSIEKIQG